ncbi:ABC transporter permease [Spirillospora sp. NBC_01491]|uniref:ABC transporter permease n=1 Tax=Spirillospora sp. NBC_01491 TaxID=2976007 RepID=UPI002E315B48|nr:ABC transporter permease [Spirillospora sp. NBC_01491]
MAVFLARRLAYSAVLAVLGASLTYVLAATALRPRAGFETRTPRPPEAVVHAELRRLNLDDRVPLAVRYRTWAAGVVRGDLGRTRQDGPVGAELRRRAGVSVRLLLPGTVLGCALGVLLGAYAAARRGRAADRAIAAGSALLPAVPVFVLAVLLQFAAGKVNDVTGMRIFEWTGESSPGAGGPADRVRHLLLPTVTIALSQVALYCRYQRGLMLDVLSAEHMRTARAKGLRRRRVLLRHGLRVALVPMTAYSAYAFGLMLVGAAFTEKVFGWHGLGEWLVESIGHGDVNAVAAVGSLAAGTVLLAGLVSDVVRGVLDPRTRTAEVAAAPTTAAR